MRPSYLALPFILCLTLLSGFAADKRSGRPANSAEHGPSYTADARLQPLVNYREWIFLTSGFDMSYSPRVSGKSAHPMFDNVFVNPEAYHAFLETGTWPDQTMLVLEVRPAESALSINKSGRSQSERPAALEVHVKDASHGGWAFYEFSGNQPAKLISKEASCYSCHGDHGAVDTTFVQFYPTLLPLARKMQTLSGDYRKNPNVHAQ